MAVPSVTLRVHSTGTRLNDGAIALLRNMLETLTYQQTVQLKYARLVPTWNQQSQSTRSIARAFMSAT